MAVVPPPSFRMTLGEIDFQNPEFNKRVIKIKVNRVADGPSDFEVHLDDAPIEGTGKPFFSDVNAGKIKEGGTALIKLGYTGGPYPTVMDGVVTKLEAKRESREKLVYIIKGFDYMHRLTRGKKERNFMNQKSSDIASALISEVGLSPRVKSTSVKHEHLIQNNVTNLDYLYELGKQEGYQLEAKGKEIYFEPYQEKKSSVADLIWDFNNLNRNNPKHVVCEKCEFETTSMGQVKEVEVRWWDPKTKEQIVGKATGGGNTMGGDIDGGAAAAKDAPGGGEKLTVTDRPVKSIEEADAVAAAILKERSTTFVKARVTCEGDGRIIPNVMVNLDAFGKQMDGMYKVATAKHTMNGASSSSSGYETTAELIRDGRPSA